MSCILIEPHNGFFTFLHKNLHENEYFDTEKEWDDKSLCPWLMQIKL